MWSVVEKTALAEAEIEYEDYTSDTVWVKFPVAMVDRKSAIDQNTKTDWRAIGRYLDHDALDAAGQPGDHVLAEDQLRPV